jgi:CDP-diacylglycerol---glycerol-3-phosphate 3-phosphatidyltransferase
MFSIYGFKPRFQALLRPVAASLARAGVTANHVTLTAVALSIGYGAAITATHGATALLLGLPLVLLLRMALNAIDGMVAREFGQKSDLGLVLNELGDVVSDAALYLPFALISGFDPALVVTLVVFAVLTEFTGLLAIPLARPRNYAGPFGKSDRAAFFGALAMLVGFGVLPALWLDVILAAGVLLSLLTIVNRARGALAT